MAATNCLNFGNPEKPEIMAQLSAAIDGIAEACTALGTPITGGNVSLYNETRGEGIYPTPVLGIVGILDDVTKAVPADFQRAGDAILLLWPIPARRDTRSGSQGSVPARADQSVHRPGHDARPAVSGRQLPPLRFPSRRRLRRTSAAELTAFGSSEYAKVVLGGAWGQPPPLDLDAEADLHTLLIELARRKLDALRPRHLRRRHRRGRGPGHLRKRNRRNHRAGPLADGSSPLRPLCRTRLDRARHRCSRQVCRAIEEIAGEHSFFAARIGTTGGDRLEITVDGEPFISASLEELRKPWATALEATLHGEVPA